MVTRLAWDDAGRSVETIQNYQEHASGADVNVTTRTTYTPDGGVDSAVQGMFDHTASAMNGQQPTSIEAGASTAALHLGEVRSPGFKLFGLQRSCTNLVRRGLLDNFLVDSLERGWEWKHGPIRRIAEHQHNGRPVLFIVCVRNPYAWMPRCYRYFSRQDADPSCCRHFRRGMSFRDFVTSPHYEFPSPADRWTTIYDGYVRWLDAHLEAIYKVILPQLAYFA